MEGVFEALFEIVIVCMLSVLSVVSTKVFVVADTIELIVSLRFAIAATFAKLAECTEFEVLSGFVGTGDVGSKIVVGLKVV